ncbi:uncharacterized protein UV8b_04955 [Ustilaginoidea virens]|uniref:Cystein rich protein n=1 Tax=Ustilaginoidea virens TaxID=1159556 RepID=A0A8E5HT44_USTVR|nr:uncharacterized protein UV8b_04955 [Ustilaginoidea virens]QUC20714.1 hypothetical protein UV8b_04955 [Ustilaginoidea virens]
MKNLQLSLLFLLFRASPFEAKNYKKNIPTFEVGPGAKIVGNRIEYDDPDCDPGLECKTTKMCAAAGTSPTLSDDKKYFACCAAGQRLLGSPETAFDCCAAGHDLVGSPEHGWHCCPTGFEWDGNLCKQVCKNGKVLVDGKCVCPAGQEEGPDGHCKDKPKPPVCCSGLETGKCYIFKAENGNRLGLRNDNVYYAAPDSMIQRYGKFQICADEKCTPGSPVNPSTQVYIRDTYGDLATGANKGQWLNGAQNGAHIGRTPNFSLAGKFSISKWPCGKYCLGGFTQGVGPACPADIPAMTFYSLDPQMCVAFDFTEVPCDIKNDANSCIWKNGDQCCNKVDCAKKDKDSADIAAVNLPYGWKFVLVALNLALVAITARSIRGGRVGHVVPRQDDLGRWSKKAKEFVFWDSLFPQTVAE